MSWLAMCRMAWRDRRRLARDLDAQGHAARDVEDHHRLGLVDGPEAGALHKVLETVVEPVPAGEEAGHDIAVIGLRQGSRR